MDSQHLPFPQKGLVMPSCICSQDPLPCRFAPDIGATWIKKAPVTPSEKAILCLRNPKNMSWWDFEGRCWILSHIYSILFMLNLGLTLVGRHSLVVWHGGWQNRFNKKKHLKKLDIGYRSNRPLPGKKCHRGLRVSSESSAKKIWQWWWSCPMIYIQKKNKRRN
jgi:hypothetical protein